MISSILANSYDAKADAFEQARQSGTPQKINIELSDMFQPNY